MQEREGKREKGKGKRRNEKGEREKEKGERERQHTPKELNFHNPVQAKCSAGRQTNNQINK